MWIEVSSGDPPELTYQTSPNALSRLIRSQLGKTILFTDSDDWTNEEIVLAYRSQHHVEDAFERDHDDPWHGRIPSNTDPTVNNWTCPV